MELNRIYWSGKIYDLRPEGMRFTKVSDPSMYTDEFQYDVVAFA